MVSLEAIIVSITEKKMPDRLELKEEMEKGRQHAVILFFLLLGPNILL